MSLGKTLKPGIDQVKAFSMIHVLLCLLAQRNAPKISGDKALGLGLAQSAPTLVYDQNQGSVSLLPIFFSFETETFFSNYFHIFPLLSGIYFLKSLKLNTDFQK